MAPVCDNFLFNQFLVFLQLSQENEGGRLSGFTFFDSHDHVGAPDPVGFFEVGRRPVRRMVGMGVVKADDVEAARAFYGAVFGWTTIDVGSPMWALPGYGDHLEELNPGLRAGMKQMGAPEGFENVVATILPREGGPARWSVTFAVDDVDAIAARARELGGSVLAEPQNAPWVRFAVLADPAGASFTASQFVAENR